MINTKGEFEVTIREPFWTKMEEKQGDDTRIALVFPCYTEPNHEYPNGQRIDFHLYFTRQLVRSGNNRGRPVFKVSREQCLDLGMSEPFHPEKIGELDGVRAILVTDEEVYNNKPRIVAKWLNNPKKKKISGKEASSIWDKMISEDALPSESKEEDIPY